ncbi:MAG: DNA-deoxyinosine glycosylase [Lachnospiraceae bacterium]|nr:DNA-deoxyinosine glycosylase [Lachnospiraceae bacterium]
MKLQTVIHPFMPICDKDCKVLILGTIPSETSRAKGFYYASSSNKFWNLISDICGCPKPVTIEEKTTLLLSHHIAIWDVYEQTKIHKSLDSTITRKNSSGTDIASLIEGTKITKIFANGDKAEKGYNWFAYDSVGIPIIRLPSSSGLYTGMTYAEKLKAWSVIKEYLE